jgi:ApaG protein
MPAIAPNDSYDYVSGCPLDTSSGTMSGHYQFVDQEGARVDATIPEFALLAPTERRH